MRGSQGISDLCAVSRVFLDGYLPFFTRAASVSPSTSSITKLGPTAWSVQMLDGSVRRRRVLRVRIVQ
jgi:hypothetical protein